MNREERERLKGRLIRGIPKAKPPMGWPDRIRAGQWWQYGMWDCTNPDPMSPERVVNMDDLDAVRAMPLAGGAQRFIEAPGGLPIPAERWHYLGDGEAPAL